MKICLQCGKEFEPNHPTRKLCSDTCYRLRLITLNRARSAKAHKHYARKPCLICQAFFVPKSKKQIICTKPECKRKRYALQHSKPLQKRNCVICGRALFATNAQRLTCKTDACRSQHRANMVQARGKVKLEKKQPEVREMLTTQPYSHAKSLFAKAIAKFLRSGGKVKRQRLGPELDFIKDEELAIYEW